MVSLVRGVFVAGLAVLAAGGVREGAPLGCLVDVALLQDEATVGADGVTGCVIHHHRHREAAVLAV